MRWPWQRKAPSAPLPQWLVQAHAHALIVIAAAEIMRREPALIPIMRPGLLSWAKSAVEALKPAAVPFSDAKILRWRQKR